MNTLQLNMVVTLFECLIPFGRVQLFIRVTTMFYNLIIISHISCWGKIYLGCRVSSNKSNIQKKKKVILEELNRREGVFALQFNLVRQTENTIAK